MKIAYGNSRFDKKWKNSDISWEAFCEKVKVTQRTTETIEEYFKLKKVTQDNIKDVGGFVGGHLKEGRRKKGYVLARSMLTLDMDYGTSGILDELEFDYKVCIYSTHKNTKEKPRLRLIIPLTRDVSSEEYAAVARMVAKEIGIDLFDDTTYEPERLMYWPSTPRNGDYIFKVFEGEFLNPDEYLRRYDDWKDASTWPVSSRQSEVINREIKEQADPLSKEGIVGAFCRTYTIQEAIEKFLNDVYEPSAISGRYDYIPADSSAGVQIFDDKFAYSHHATDPACNKLLNAFDIVRIHRFGEEEKSYSQMCELALNDEEVKKVYSNEKFSEVEIDFKLDDNWKSKLKYNKNGQLENSVYNLNIILNNDKDFKNFAFNELANRIQITGSLPWERPEGNSYWRDADTAQLKSIIDIRYLPFSNRNHDIAFTKVADDRHFHPIRDYLDSLPKWDGVKRVEEVFIKYLKAEDTEYVRAVTRKTFAAAVARIYNPGIKFDCVPVLDGDQGIGKSTILKDLVTSEYYSETLALTDMDDKSGAEKLQGFWIVEIGELAGMKKADIEKVKAFLSTSDDKYRPSYGRVVESHPRQCIIIATVNGERGYLRDITGNRRFWIIKVHQKKQRKNWNFDDDFRMQFWAEAKQIWENGEKLYLEGSVLEESEKIQKESMETDERVGMIEEYLNKKLPTEWDGMDLFERRNFLTGSEFGEGQHEGTVFRNEVSNAEIWCECFNKNLQELKPTDSYAIAAMMSQIPNWERTQSIKRQAIYGRQRLYVRKN